MNLRKVPYKWLVATAFVTGLFMDIMDTTIVNVALPTIGRDFVANIGTLEWIVTGYLISLAIWIPASGWIGDRFGTKKTFAFALTMFIAGSALCGLAWSASSIIAISHAMQHAQLFAFHAAFAASIIFGLLGIVFALRIHDEDAAPSTGGRPSQAATDAVG